MYHRLISHKCVWLLAGGIFPKKFWYGALAKAALRSWQQTSCHLVFKKVAWKATRSLQGCASTCGCAPTNKKRVTRSWATVRNCTIGLGEGSELKVWLCTEISESKSPAEQGSGKTQALTFRRETFWHFAAVRGKVFHFSNMNCNTKLNITWILN